MIQLNIHGLEKELQSSIFRPFYFLFGSEFYLIKKSMNLIKTHLLPSKDDLDFNFHQVYLSQYGISNGVSKTLEAARTLPFFSQKKLIFVREVDLLREKDWQVFFKYFKKPVFTSVLVFISEKEDQGNSFKKKLDGFFRQEKIRMEKSKPSFIEKAGTGEIKKTNGKEKDSILETLRKEPCFLEAKRVTENQIAFWIRKIANQKDLFLDSGAIALMSQVLRTHLFLIDQELEKLSLNFKKRKIKGEEILKFLTASKKENVFDLVHFVGRRNLRSSLRMMKSLLDYGESAYFILALIFRHIQILFKVQWNLKKDLSRSQLVQKLKLPSFFISDYIEQARLWSENQLIYAFQSLHETDRGLKSSLIPDSILMDQLLLKILYR